MISTRLTAGKPHPPTFTSPIHKTLDTLYVILKWKKPENDGGDPNIRYRLVYKEINDTLPRIIKDLNVTQFIVVKLKPGARYRFQVFAVNSGGESDPAQEIYSVSPDALGLYQFFARLGNLLRISRYIRFVLKM